MNTKPYHLNNINLLAENDRSLYEKEKEDGTVCYDSTSHSKIDFTRTHLNYNVCPHEQYDKKKILEIHETIRGKKFPKNGVLFGCTVITLPKDFDGDSRQFFQTAYDGLKEIYKLNDDDIISAYVHMDETTPHLHFNFIPHHENTISWEKTMPKHMFDTQHKKLEDFMNEKNIGTVHLLNGQTLGFDVQQLSPEQKTISMEIYELKEERNEIYQQIASKEAHKQKLEKDINYYTENNNWEKVEDATLEWENCSAELSKLAKKKKELGKQLDDKFKELNNDTKPNSNQRQIFELVADKVNSEAEMQEANITIEKLKSECKLAHDEVAELKTEFNNIIEEHSKQAEDMFKAIADGVQDAVSNAYVMGKNAPKDMDVERSALHQNDSIRKAVGYVVKPLQSFHLYTQSLHNKMNEIIEQFKHNSNVIRQRRNDKNVVDMDNTLEQNVQKSNIQLNLENTSMDENESEYDEYPF